MRKSLLEMLSDINDEVVPVSNVGDKAAIEDAVEKEDTSLTEAKKPSDVSQKFTQRSVTSDDYVDKVGSPYRYTSTHTYTDSTANGYIMDKNGERYDVKAWSQSSDTGHIAGGTTNYYVRIYYKDKELGWWGYNALFSNPHNANIISDLKQGYYLEDYCAKHPDGSPGNIVRELAAQGNADAVSYSTSKYETASDKISSRYTKLNSNNSYHIKIDYPDFTVESRREENDELIFNSQEFKDTITNALAINGYSMQDFNGAEIYCSYTFTEPDSYRWDSKGFFALDNKTHEFKYIYEKRKKSDHSFTGYGQDSVKLKLKIYTINLQDCDFLNQLVSVIKKSRKSARAQSIKEIADSIFDSEMRPERGQVGIARGYARQRAMSYYDDETDEILKGKSSIQFNDFIKFVNAIPAKELDAAEREVENASNSTEDTVNNVVAATPNKAVYDKMAQWNAGLRRENYRACSDEKLLMYYNVCKEQGYEEQQNLLRDEINRRNIPFNESYNRNYSYINEASYGGAYDITDDQYFTKDELVEFAEEIIDELDCGKCELVNVEMDGNALSICIDCDGVEECVTFTIDMRKIKSPRHIMKYTTPFVKEFTARFCNDEIKESVEEPEVKENFSDEYAPHDDNWAEYKKPYVVDPHHKLTPERKSELEKQGIEIKESVDNTYDFVSMDLLSIEEAEELPQELRKYVTWWWLKSQGKYLSSAAAVHRDGSFYRSGYSVFEDFGTVRPALTISNLNSFNLEVGDIIKIDNEDWIVINDQQVLYNGHPIKHRFDIRFSDYETSEIKKFIDEWFRKIKASQNTNESLRENYSQFEYITSKSVPDYDGFMTDYTMYYDNQDKRYVFVFGDNEVYLPEDEDFDYECDTEKEAYEWFDNYEGFVDDYMNESIKMNEAPDEFGLLYDDEIDAEAQKAKERTHKLRKQMIVSKFNLLSMDLLSVEEADKLPTSISRYKDCWWWLRSPGYFQHYAVGVNPYGVVIKCGGTVDHTRTVRPALTISNLKDFNLKVGDEFTINNQEWIVINDHQLLYNSEPIFHIFDSKSNDYETSEIKKFIDNWFNEIKASQKGTTNESDDEARELVGNSDRPRSIYKMELCDE